MSVFHGLSLGKGTKPLRLPPCPTVIALHADGAGPPPPPPPPFAAVTCKFAEVEELLPGFGFSTEIPNEPADDAVPVAVSFAEETKLVASADPANSTFAPLTKPLPFTVSEKFPELTDVGAMLLSTGTGLSSVSVAVHGAVGSAALVASMVTTFDAGTTDGAA